MNSTAHVDEEVHGRVLEVDLHGRLSCEDYKRFVPETEKLILKYGKIRVLIIMHDFHGWDAKASWADIKWNAKHFNQIERLAIVGKEIIEGPETSGAFNMQFSRTGHWHRWMRALRRPFANTEVRYFPLYQIAAAHAWINEFQ